MNRLIIAGNWKMHKDFDEMQNFCADLKIWMEDYAPTSRVMLFPPALYVHDAATLLKTTTVELGAQNVFYESSGAFTGEISASMIASTGGTVALIGHSERRHVFGDTNEDCNKKMHAVLKKGLSPVLCVGETGAERDANKTIDILDEQLRVGLAEVSIEQCSNLIIAYEPVWAIGTGNTASPDQAQEAHHFIRRWLIEKYGMQRAINIPILYGGSVKPQNAATLLLQPDIDGALIGGASLDFVKFTSIVLLAEEIPMAETC